MEQNNSTRSQATETACPRHSELGRTIIETLAVVTIAAILTSVTIPQIISARRLMRSASLPREIATQLRYARQQAMSQRQVFTFQYDDSTKTINIIDHNNSNNLNVACNVTGKQVMGDASYPNTACATTVLSVPVAGGNGSLPASELTFGVPGTISSTTLGDTSVPTALTSSKINVSFQQDGTVVDSNGTAMNPTLFFYNNKVPNQTAVAISILGTAGRIKIWRYDTSAQKYLE
jgi:Tfp pilus assembly protein FimT